MISTVSFDKFLVIELATAEAKSLFLRSAVLPPADQWNWFWFKMSFFFIFFFYIQITVMFTLFICVVLPFVVQVLCRMLFEYCF